MSTEQRKKEILDLEDQLGKEVSKLDSNLDTLTESLGDVLREEAEIAENKSQEAITSFGVRLQYIIMQISRENGRIANIIDRLEV